MGWRGTGCMTSGVLMGEMSKSRAFGWPPVMDAQAASMTVEWVLLAFIVGKNGKIKFMTITLEPQTGLCGHF